MQKNMIQMCTKNVMPSLSQVTTFKFKDKIFSQKKAKQRSFFKMQQLIEVDVYKGV